MPRFSQLDSFRCRVNKRFCLELKTYQDLHRWSVENIAAFWAEFWDFSGLLYSQPYTQVLPEKAGIADIPEWFKGSRLNFAENLLRCQDNQQIALYATGEQRDKMEIVTFGELKRRVGKMAVAMREMGLKPGDVVAGYLPNCVLAVVAMLATATVGAIWTCTSPEFGVEAVLSRFSQLSPHLLLSVDCVIYNRKSYSQLDKVKHISKALPSLQRVVITPYVEARKNIDISEIPHSMFIEDFNALGKDREIVNGEGNGVEETADVELTFEQLPFSCPLLIAFTSGTTGAPKGLVHSVGGVLIKQMEEHLLQGELGAGDLMCFYTTTGWMMWNWLIAAISVGASVLLYDGSPLVPSPSALLDLVDQLGVSVLGVSPKLLSLLEDDGHRPMQTHKLQSLHTILSTGSVLPARSFNYVYNEVKSDVQLVSISGGTDIMGCFVGPCPGLHPLPGEIPGPLLGMAIESWDEDGRRLFGESGELVCTQPFPSQPLYFWGDDLGKKYHQAYFSKFKGIWAHGDYCKINPESGRLVMLGRSDGTLNPNGVRFGSTEIYNIVEAFPEILDSLCVAQRSERGEERAVLFLKPSPGYKLNLELCTKLRQAIRNSLSPRHVPAVLLEIKDIPYTVSGKKVENAVRRVIEGEKPRLLGTLTNPESLSLFYNLPELHGY